MHGNWLANTTESEGARACGIVKSGNCCADDRRHLSKALHGIEWLVESDGYSLRLRQWKADSASLLGFQHRHVALVAGDDAIEPLQLVRLLQQGRSTPSLRSSACIAACRQPPPTWSDS